MITTMKARFYVPTTIEPECLYNNYCVFQHSHYNICDINAPYDYDHSVASGNQANGKLNAAKVFKNFGSTKCAAYAPSNPLQTLYRSLTP